MSTGRAHRTHTAAALAGASEPELITRCVEGDQRAFAELMTRHQRMLYAICLRMTLNPDDAQEALQETLVRVWRMIGGFEQRSRFSTWLYRVATNAALEELRKRARRPEPVDLLAAQDWLGEDASARPTDADVVDRLTVDGALARLPLTYRAAVVLRDLCGCSYEEIAELLDVPVNTVKSRISRGRQSLVTLLRPSTV
jgi:RNA polymerase sigma-70 factor (ECF subfamily)